MAIELINVRTYNATWAIDASLTPTIQIFDNSDNSLDFSGTMSWNAIILQYQFSPNIDATKTYTCNVDFWSSAFIRYTTFWLSQVVSWWSGWLTTEEHTQLMGLYNSWWGGIIDTTKSHEEIIKKFDLLLKKELKEIIASIKVPTIDLWPIEQAIKWIKPTDISGFIQGISDMKTHIKNLSENVVKEYEKKKAEIEMKYRDEIDKKNSLLSENEYNLKEKQWEIDRMSWNIQDLLTEIETIKTEKEKEIQIIEDTYLSRIEEVKVEIEGEIVEKIIPLLS
jgi:hypothetical protein